MMIDTNTKDKADVQGQVRPCGKCGNSACPHRQTLEIKDLHVNVEGKPVLNGLTLTIRSGEIHVLMGPNAAGKSTLANAISGHPETVITQGSITLNGEDLLALSPDERARRGIFLAFQNPVEVDGVNLGSFLFHTYKARYGKDASPSEFNKRLTDSLRVLQLDRNFIDRQLNVGFSGGEKKRAEMLQLLILKPAFAFFDETDSGLDIDSLKIVRDAFNTVRGPCLGVIMVTHYPKVAQKVDPDYVHVIVDGKVVVTGDKTLVDKIDDEGYGWLAR